MLKEHSLNIENQMSTQIGDTLKSYSSKYRQLKQMRSQKNNIENILPIKLERSAIIIQRFWRNRMILRKKLYQKVQEELDKHNSLLQFQNQALQHITNIYQKDCSSRKQMLESITKGQVENAKKQSTKFIKKLVALTLQLDKRKISKENLQLLLNQKEESQHRIKNLEKQKEHLQKLLCEQSQEESFDYIHRIKEANLNLLKVSKKRGNLQKQIRERIVQNCKNQIQL